MERRTITTAKRRSIPEKMVLYDAQQMFAAMAWAAYSGDAEAVRRLHKEGCPLDVDLDREHGTALHCAAAGLSLDACRLLIDLGAPLDARNRQGKTPLHEASDQVAKRMSSPPISSVEETHALLLDAGADPSVRDGTGRTALHAAAQVGAADSCALMVAAGAPLNGVDDDLNTAMHTACLFKQRTAEQSLLGMGARTDLFNERGDAALHEAVRVNNDGACLDLLAAGVSPDQLNSNGEAALVQACQNLLGQAAGVLLRAGADVGVRNRLGQGLIVVTAIAENRKTAERAGFCINLMAYGACADDLIAMARKDPSAVSGKILATVKHPLRAAVQHGGPQLCLALIERGWDPSDRRGTMKSALEEAQEMGNSPVLRILQAASARAEAMRALEAMDSPDQDAQGRTSKRAKKAAV